MRSLLRSILVIGTLFALSRSAAVAVDIDASLNRDTVGVEEIAELTIAVTGRVAGVGRPEIPTVDYLSVVSSSSQKSIELIDGEMRSTTTYTFGIRASREGVYEIPRIEVRVDDTVMQTRALTLNVIDRSDTGPPSDRVVPEVPEAEMPEIGEQAREERADIEATTEVDDPNPWVGQQVTLTLTFMQSHRTPMVGNAEYAPPSTEGLIAEALPDEPQRTVHIDGVPYEVSTRKTALMAPAPGEYTIGPADITFRRSYMQGQEHIRTDPITLRVRPLPDRGRPEEFSGIVGRLDARMSAPSEKVRAGEALSLRLTVTGVGDLRQLEAPRVTTDGNARVDVGAVEREISPQRTQSSYLIGGRVQFDYLLVPREAGPLRVMPAVLHYFDPATGRYERTQTAEILIDVQPGDPGQLAAEDQEADLRYIKEDGGGLRARDPVTGSTWFWAMQILPLVGLAWAARRRAELLRRERDPAYRRRVEALEEANARLREAARVGEAVEVFRRADEALAGYIAAKTGVSEAAISPNRARELLVQAGAADDLAQRSSDLLISLRAGAYAPGTGEEIAPLDVPGRVRALLGELEGALR